MIKDIKYVPIIKTGDAELRAISNLSEDIKHKCIPLFELTRGRRAKNDKIGEVKKRLDVLRKYYVNHPFILDLTGDAELTNNELIALHSSENDYENWVNFCIEQKKTLGTFYPMVQIEEEEMYDNYINKLIGQIISLTDKFDYIVFRSQDEESSKNLISDIKTIIDSKRVKNFESKIIFVLDYRYIVNAESGGSNAISFINILNTLNIKNIIIASTSFPANVSAYMSSDYCQFAIKERAFFFNVKRQIAQKGLNIIYGDYASINPIRNDTVTFARGWIPRIDVPSFDLNIHIQRKRRDKIDEVFSSYKDTYEELARKVAIQKYFQDVQKLKCWGLDEIVRASEGDVSGASPRFWISVRMDIYINLMISTIYLS